MRLFNLFLRRAGIQQAPLPVRNSLSRFTVMCSRKDMAEVRKHIYSGFGAAGLKVAGMRVEHGHDPEMAAACVTVNCPPEMRQVLMNQARQLRAYPPVRGVQWGDHRHIALN